MNKSSGQLYLEKHASMKRKFENIRVGTFVCFGSVLTTYEVRRSYKKVISLVIGFEERMLDLKPTGVRYRDDYIRRIGHMDSDASKMRVLSRPPPELAALLAGDHE